MIKDHTKGSSS